MSFALMEPCPDAAKGCQLRVCSHPRKKPYSCPLRLRDLTSLALLAPCPNADKGCQFPVCAHPR
jgi:hypothetical protein